GRPAVALLGDDEGLEAAAVMLAGHLPNLWDQKSATIGKVAEDVGQFLSGKRTVPVSAQVSAISVQHGAEGVRRAFLDLQMARADDVIKGQVALNQLKATGARDPKRALSFTFIRMLTIRLHARGTPATVVNLPRAAAANIAAAPPPGRRPGSGTKENFDLSSFYTNDGALGDSDNNLIPDRVDVVLSPGEQGSAAVVDLAARLGLESTGVALPIARPAG